MAFSSIGKMLIVLGCIVVLVGIVVTILGKAPLIGKLPGDVYIKKENFTFYFPIATCMLISIILSVILFLIGKK